MPRQQFFQSLHDEIARIDEAGVSKRNEKLIERFTNDACPRAVIGGQDYRVFNSNDYLGLRHHQMLKKAEYETSEACGTGPGAVRFISGSFAVHRNLEQALATFHNRDDAMVFSSAFATNFAVLFSLIKGQSKDSLVSSKTLVVSDELNHRSIIDGIRVAGLGSEQKAIFAHMDMESLRQVLKQNLGRFDRVVVVSDGVFSMLGEYQDLAAIRGVVDEFDNQYPQGVLMVIDDCHGIAAFGKTGRGTEEVSGGRADVLIGTLGKGLGADGGYVVADQVVIDYLRESAASYIYSNSIAPGTAAAALAAVQLLQTDEGQQLVEKLAGNVKRFKTAVQSLNIPLAADSIHPIQPLLIGEPLRTKELTQALFEQGFLVTNINYPVVPKGKDEIRVQLSASHDESDIAAFLEALERLWE